MLIAKELKRVFIMKERDREINLPDPEPKMDALAVLNYYSNQYPILNNATVSPPKFGDDKVLYTFDSIMGTKG